MLLYVNLADHRVEIVVDRAIKSAEWQVVCNTMTKELANQSDLLRQRCPQLARVCFHRKTSGKFAPQFGAAGYDTLVLPSSSPANAKTTFTQKLQLWRSIIS